MFDLGGENSQKIDDMYERYQLTPKAPDVDDVLSLINMFSLNSIMNIPCGSYVEFMGDVTNNITTGRWTMLPTMWASHTSVDLGQQITSGELERARLKMAKAFQDCMRGIGLRGTTEVVTRKLALHWIRNENGFDAMLQTAKVFNDLNKLFSKKGN